MIPFPRLLQIFFAAFATIADAALVNVTVDDAVLTGPVVPQYLPSPANWNAAVNGNSCTNCGTIKLDPLQVYNATWHDATYELSNGFTQVIEFTFTGSAVYIFFVIANQVVGDSSTLTDVQFVLDQVTVGRYTHPPTTSTDYQYNVAVYSNDSLVLGPHNMMVQPVNTGNNVLMLFDYLIYTIDTSSSVSSSSSPSPTVFPSTSFGTRNSSPPNIAMIVGASVGGVALIGAALICYRWYNKRYNGDRLERSDEMGLVAAPSILPRDAVATSFISTTTTRTSAQPMTREPISDFRPRASSAATLPSNPPTPTSGAASSRRGPLREQVEQLRDEVTRLRALQKSSLELLNLSPREPPPYS